MPRLVKLSAVLAWALCLSRAAVAEPAWGRNCLSCHDYLLSGTIYIVGEDLYADPDESATGALDRGSLPVFQTNCAATRTLHAMLTGLDTNDRYAVELGRLRFPGVESGGQLAYTGDCEWAEWGDSSRWYTEPFISHTWGTGPDAFDFDVDVANYADGDYYDLVFAVAGKLAATGDLFYAEQHFYLQVQTQLGDLNCDGSVSLADLGELLAAYGSCQGDPVYDPAADFDGDNCITVSDLATLLAVYGT